MAIISRTGKRQRSARDPKTGKSIRVPADMTYSQWYAKYVDNEGESDIIQQGGSFLDKYRKTDVLSNDDIELKMVNPNYGQPGYVLNCANCTVAYEARKRGYDVEANPSDVPILMSSYVRFFNGAGFLGLNNFQSKKDAIAKIERYINSWGEGARGTIFVKWINSRDGHYLSCEVAKNGIKYIDPQTATELTSGLFYKAEMQHTAFMRVDDLSFSKFAENTFRERQIK